MRLFRKKEREAESVEEVPLECPHVTLVARWENADDIGHEDRASSFHCEACGRDFTIEEATRLRRTEEERVRERIAS